MPSELRVRLVDISELKGHERTDECRLKALKDEIESDGILKKPIVVDERTKVILDGHHRVEALRLLGCSRIPVCLVNYASEKIGVKGTNKNLEVTKPKVLEAALKGEPFPPKSTWHYVTFSKTIKHISYIQRRVDIPLKDLKRE
ncbi:ParB N-terminal domain-containing protein [Candidatus Bathyarchaeota archaeon]|nr:ParB N-terminal domain-containing protein [Candidatus Bathyarchaeota archaeon]